MDKVNKYLNIILALCMALFFTAYAHAADPPYGVETRKITDMTGATIILPPRIEKILITCYGGASHEIALLGGADRIIAQPSMERFPQLLKIYKGFADVPDAGSFNNVNLEHVMTLRPDIVFAGVTSDQGNQKIRELDIPVVVLGIGQNTTDTLLKEFKMIGHILGTEKQAAELIAYWEKKIKLIKQKTASVPEEKKKRVFYSSSGLPFRTDGRLWWGHYFIETAGGINVSRELGSSGEITPEQLLLWNPDFIITSTNKDNRTSPDEIRNSLKIKNVKAVKNNTVYQCPIGAFWWDRPSPEAILGIIWLAGMLYPDLMADIDLETEIINFFKQFYQYDLSKQEYNAFFNTGKIKE